jgi:hypothetical protein
MRKAMKQTANRGVSTVVGSVLFMILIASVMSTLFVTLFQFNNSSQKSIIQEQARTQENFVIDELIADTGFNIVSGIHVNNTGSIAIRVSAIYINSVLFQQPTGESTTVDPKEGSTILFTSPVGFNAESKISITSERGVKTLVKEGDFLKGQNPPVQEQELYFGPLKLDFQKFFYAKYQGNNYPDSEGWISGWQVDKGTELVWNITVTDIDYRPITLNKYSCLTLIPNDGGAQLPWYIEKIEHSDGSNSMTIAPEETVTITYRWATAQQAKSVSVFSSRAECRVFLTFYGVFNEFGNTRNYGQTIPFEAVLVS